MTGVHLDEAAELYERDFYAWTQRQARELRRMRQSRSNLPLDLRNLAEEVASLGRSQRDAVHSHLRVIMEHLLKLDHSPSRQPRTGWMRSIATARAELRDKMSASLARTARRGLQSVYEDARRIARLGLEEHDEREAAANLPEACPYTLPQLARDDWYSTASGRQPD
jgi:hypothetical protein